MESKIWLIHLFFLQCGDLRFEGGDAGFHVVSSRVLGGSAGGGLGGGFVVAVGFGEEVAEGFDAAARSGGDALDEGAVGIVDEGGEDFFDLIEGVEVVQALGAGLEFAGGLGAA